MFTMRIKRTGWRGEQVKARLRAQGMEAARQCAEFMAARARLYVPVDTGFLRESIVVMATMSGTRYSVIATANYARYVEFGHMAGGTWVPPNPFMRRALADARRQFPAILKDVRLRAPGDSGTHLGTSFTA